MSKIKLTGHSSGSGVITVTAPNTSTDRTITLPDSTDTLIGTATTDALTTRVNGAGGRKNIIINGAMNVAQRGTSVTGVGDADNGFHTCDRWEFVESGSPSSIFTLTQSTDSPSGFGSSMKFDCTQAASTLASNEQLRLRYKIEGQDLQQLKKGTSEAESFTLSFWVKSYTTGVAIVNFYAASRHIAAPYTINSSATWEKKTITFSGDSTGVIPNDNADGLQIWFQLYAGSQNTSGTLATSWAAYNEANSAVGQVLNIASSTDNYFQITGVQLELGSVATDFEYRSYGEELALCQRYYQRITQSAGDFYIMASKGQSSDTTRFAQTLARPLRASPTISQGGGFLNWRCFRGTSGVLTSTSTPATVGFVENAGFVSLQVAGFSGLTDNYFYGTSPAFSSSGYFDMDSEL